MNLTVIVIAIDLSLRVRINCLKVENQKKGITK